MDKLSNAVAKMYNSFPYPNYPLLVKLRWQDGILASSLFSRTLLESKYRSNSVINNYKNRKNSILIAGCGEVLPYILRKLEPWSHHMTFVDIAQKSLLRAKLRLLLNPKPTKFECFDLDRFLNKKKEKKFHHIDCYGVLHHLPSPSKTLTRFSSILHPGGTMRIMVYNNYSRDWIFHLQRAFSLLKLEYSSNEDLSIAQKIINSLSLSSETLKEKFSCMGKKTITNRSRLVDTFFHVREARISISQWYDMFEERSLKPIGLFDRYGELDDLANPLWQSPTKEELECRAIDGRFENNLELFLTKKEIQDSYRNSPETYFISKKINKLHLQLKTPPKNWFQYEETQKTPIHIGYQIWLKHIQFIHGEKTPLPTSLLNKIPISALKRFARIGAIFPGQIESKSLLQEIEKPITAQMEPRVWESATPLERTASAKIIRDILKKKGIYSTKREEQILKRLNKAQD